MMKLNTTLFTIATLTILFFLNAFGTNPEEEGRQLLALAERQADSLLYTKAYSTAQQAEKLLSPILSSTDPALVQVYYVLGVSGLRVNPDMAGYFIKKLQAVKPHISPELSAQVEVLEGVSDHLGGRDSLAMIHYTLAVSYYENNLPDAKYLGMVFNNIGLMNYNRGNNTVAAFYYDKTISIWEKVFGREHPAYAKILNNKSLVLREIGLFDDALTGLKEALRIRENTLPAGHTEIGANAVNIGLIYADKGSFEQAKEFFEQAIHIFQGPGGETYLPFAYNNLGLAYSGLREYDKAEYFYRAAFQLDQIKEREVVGQPESATDLYNVAVTFQDRKDYDMAFNTCQQVLSFADPNHKDYGEFLTGLGLAEAGRKHWKEAKKQFLISLNRYKGKFGDMHPQVAEAWFNLANVSIGEGDMQGALTNNKNAQLALQYTVNTNFDKVPSLTRLCMVLEQEVQIYWQMAQKEQTAANYENVKTASSKAMAAFDALYNTYFEPSAKNAVQDYSRSLLEISLLTELTYPNPANAVGHKKRAFELAEQSKARQLWESLKTADLFRLPGIDKKLALQYKYTKGNLVSFEKLRHVMLTGGMSLISPGYLEVEDSIRVTKNKIRSLEGLLQQQAPEIFDEARNLKVPDIKTIQQDLLEPDETMVEYVLGREYLFVFSISKERFDATPIRYGSNMEAEVKKMLHNGLAQIMAGEEATIEKPEANRNYISAAQNLYHQLLGNLPKQTGNSLLIIPDGIIANIPFAALLTGPIEGPFQEELFPYLVKEKQVSYCYSAALLKEMKENANAATGTLPLLAMAPFYTGNPDTIRVVGDFIKNPDEMEHRFTLEPLNGSGREIKTIAALYGTEGLYGDGATLNYFKQNAGKYRNILLSTHGVADNEDGAFSYIAFAGQGGKVERLYAREIYEMQLNASMVVLSACETGSGEIQAGEGVISVARAFSYAGASSIVTSVWRANDNATAILMISFFNQLKAGNNKQQALRQAQIDLINGHRHAYAHPAFWSGFIPVGYCH